MPKKYKSESVLHDWVHGLPFQQQALLLTAMRGPDHNNKYNSAKCIVRYLRGVVIKPAGEWYGMNDNDFMWGEYHDEMFIDYAEKFWFDHDNFPHHFIMHLVHCAQVVAYKYPPSKIQKDWEWFYLRACREFHLNRETHEEFEKRLNDFGCGWHSRKEVEA